MKTALRLSPVSLLLITFLGGCSSEKHLAAPAPDVVRNLAVLAVQSSNVPDVLELVGTVRPVQSSELASQMMGTVVQLRANEGDRVHRGQVLAILDDAQPRAALDRANAADSAAQQQLVAADSELTLADVTLKRYQVLYERKSVSPHEFDEVKARLQAASANREIALAGRTQAKAAVQEARTALNYSQIRAPFEGVVTARKVDVGTLASPGLPIFVIEDVRGFRLEVTVNESDLRYVRKGLVLDVSIDAINRGALNGRVSQIVPAADATSRTFLVKVDLPPDPELRSGLFGRASFSRGQRQSLVIPSDSVVTRGQLQGVFVLDQNQVASLRYVTLGKPAGSNVEVLSGVRAGDRLVANAGDLDLNGKRIEVQ